MFVFSRDLDILKYLLENKIDIYDIKLDSHTIPFIGLNVISYFHEQNVELFDTNENISMLVASICEYGRLDIVKFLVEKYPEIDFMKMLKSVPLSEVVSNLDFVKFMLDHGVDLYSTNEQKESVLYAVVLSNIFSKSIK